MATLDRGSKNVTQADYPVEVFYILEGQAVLLHQQNSARRLSEGDSFEIHKGQEIEIISFTSLEFFHLAFPEVADYRGILSNLGRQIAALQYCTKENLSRIAYLNDSVKEKINRDGIQIHRNSNFGITDPACVREESEYLFKTILKTHLNDQRKNYDS